MMTTPTNEIPIPPVPSAQTFTDKSGVLTQPAQQWFVNLRDKVNQINGVVIAISGSGTTLGAFNTLSPLTATGDMLTYGGGNNIRLPIGSTGQILAVVSGMPVWVNPSTGSTPLTTKGDIYGYNTAPARIPVGTDSYVLTADSTNTLGVSWKPAGTPTLPVTTKGDLLGFDTAANRVPVGTDGYILTADSTSVLGVSWKVAPVSSPLTTKGDLYGYSTTGARVPVGTDGQVLTADSTQTTGMRWKYSSFIDIFNYIMPVANNGWPNYTIRLAIPGQYVPTGRAIIIQFQTNPATTTLFSITGCWVGPAAVSGQGFPIDFASTPTQVTFGGSNTISVNGPGGIFSDPVPFSTTINTSIVISFQVTSGDAAATNTSGYDVGIFGYNKNVATDGANTTTSGYIKQTGAVSYFIKRVIIGL